MLRMSIRAPLRCLQSAPRLGGIAGRGGAGAPLWDEAETFKNPCIFGPAEFPAEIRQRSCRDHPPRSKERLPRASCWLAGWLAGWLG